MHSKLLLVDDAIAPLAAANYQDDYYDWGEGYNFRDRDPLVAGPVAREMAANFAAFWASPRSVPAERLGDVARYLRAQGALRLQPPAYRRPERVAAWPPFADDPVRCTSGWWPPRWRSPAWPSSPMVWPNTATMPRGAGGSASDALRTLIADARGEVLLQTPYLVLSKPAQRLFRSLHKQPAPPQVRISTNSLASTDAFIAYAISYKVQAALPARLRLRDPRIQTVPGGCDRPRRHRPRPRCRRGETVCRPPAGPACANGGWPTRPARGP